MTKYNKQEIIRVTKIKISGYKNQADRRDEKILQTLTEAKSLADGKDNIQNLYEIIKKPDS